MYYIHLVNTNKYIETQFFVGSRELIQGKSKTMIRKLCQNVFVAIYFFIQLHS